MMENTTDPNGAPVDENAMNEIVGQHQNLVFSLVCGSSYPMHDEDYLFGVLKHDDWCHYQ